jgi:dienelactone hydrolase
MDWVGEPQTSRGVTERRFDLSVGGEVVPGLLWTPQDAHAPRPLVLLGHGGSQHKRAPNILALARRLVRHLGFAAAAIDGPMHGDRIEGGTELMLADVRSRLADRSPDEARSMFRGAREEWKATLDALREVEGVGEGPVGYWGLSMGTIIGLPFVASEPRIDAAVLGLMGIAADARAGSAQSIDIPILFLVQWDDELVARDHALTLFDRLATRDKVMHVNPGAHAAVPVEEIMASERFFEKHLGSRLLRSAKEGAAGTATA